MTPSETKAEIRKRILAAREEVDAATRREFAALITPRLTQLSGYRDARYVMAYVGFGTEFDTSALIADVLARGKSLVLPRVDRVERGLKLYSVRDPDAELEPGVWGIREPRPDLCAEVAPAAVDFVLVPGVAFTVRCERLGYGGGYYDRLIPRFAGRAALVVAAYSLQIVAELPVTPSDRAVDLVITEEAQYVVREGFR